MFPPDPAASGAAGLRERLKRLGASRGARSPKPAPPSAGANAGAPGGADAGTPCASHAGGDGIEVIRARFGFAGMAEYADVFSGWGEGIEPEATLWLDTETTGLAGGTGTYVFLVGLGSLDGATFTVEQFLLRRLSAEGRFLSLLQARLARARHLVTFNGQRFDWPLLEARFILTRLRPVTIDVHTDLIHSARRLWHRVLGTHRLSALEAQVLGAPRSDDIPGWLIPQVYIRYLRTADRASLEPILTHNRADLLALLGLHAQVVRILRDPDRAGGRIDWEGAGVLLARTGNHRRAAECFERALAEPLDGRDRWRVLRRCARQYRSIGDGGRARTLWEEAAGVAMDDGRYGPQILMEVSRVRERAADLAGARRAAVEALRLAGAACPAWLIDRLTRRAARLGRAAPGGDA